MSGRNVGPKEPELNLFYNTTHLSVPELKLRKQGISYQNRQILKFFQDNPAGVFTPFEVQLYSHLERTPITSIRRALNTLTRSGLLIKTDFMKEGDYGAMNHTWRLL